MTDDGDLEDENDAGEPLEDCCLKYDKDQVNSHIAQSIREYIQPRVLVLVLE